MPEKPVDSVDNIFRKIVEDVVTSSNTSKLDFIPICLRLPSLSTRILFQNEGLHLGKIIHLVGDEASFKSTFALEILRWHVQNGGVGIKLDTEARPIDDIHRGLLDNQVFSRFTSVPCDSLESWQITLTKCTKQFTALNERFPVCFIVDSLMGCNSKEAIDELIKTGFPSSRYASEAKLIADFLRSYTHLLYNNPYTVCIVNHRKYRQSGYPYNRIVKTSLGGNEVRYYSSFEFELSKEKQVKPFSNNISYNVTFKVCKNTYGTDNIELTVPILFSSTAAGPSVKFCWDIATAQLLSDFRNLKPHPTETIIKNIRSICDVNSSTRGRPVYWSSALNISKENAVSAEELSIELEKRQDILNALYELLNINRRYIYDPSCSFNENMQKAQEASK